MHDARRTVISCPPMLSSIGQIAVPVKDVARAVAFYRDRLELRMAFFKDTEGNPLALMEERRGEIRVPGP